MSETELLAVAKGGAWLFCRVMEEFGMEPTYMSIDFFNMLKAEREKYIDIFTVSTSSEQHGPLREMILNPFEIGILRDAKIYMSNMIAGVQDYDFGSPLPLLIMTLCEYFIDTIPEPENSHINNSARVRLGKTAARFFSAIREFEPDWTDPADSDDDDLDTPRGLPSRKRRYRDGVPVTPKKRRVTDTADIGLSERCAVTDLEYMMIHVLRSCACYSVTISDCIHKDIADAVINMI